MLLPALSKAKAKAHAASCLNNLKQMGLGMIMYADDNNGFVPRGANSTEGEPWYRVLTPQFGGRTTNDAARARIFSCPGYPDKKQRLAYVNNNWKFRSLVDKGGSDYNQPTKITAVQVPVETIYVADYESGPASIIVTEDNPYSHHHDVWSMNHIPYNPVTTNLNVGRRVALTRHGAGPNCLFFDGHSGFKKARLITPDDWRDQRY